MGLRYESILSWSADDEAFVAEVPELPGRSKRVSDLRFALIRLRTGIREMGDGRMTEWRGLDTCFRRPSA